MSISSIRSIPLLLLALATRLSACSPTKQPSALTPVTIQLLWTHINSFGGYYAADQEGYYAAEGWAVTFREGGPNVDYLAPVVNGTAQFGDGGSDELILARAEGKPLRAVATIYQRSPVVFFTLAKSGITKPQDFRGKKIRVAPGLGPTLYAMMAHIGIARHQYTEVVTPYDIALFASGDPPVWSAYLNAFVTAKQGWQGKKSTSSIPTITVSTSMATVSLPETTSLRPIPTWLSVSSGPPIAVPVKSSVGRLVGVLSARLNLGDMGSVINPKIDPHQTDDSYLVNRSNLFVSQPRFISDPVVMRRGIHTEAVKRGLRGESGYLLARDYRDVPTIAVYRWLPTHKLCLVVERDQKEAFAPSRAFGKVIMLIALLALLVASVVAAWLARTITGAGVAGRSSPLWSGGGGGAPSRDRTR